MCCVLFNGVSNDLNIMIYVHNEEKYKIESAINRNQGKRVLTKKKNSTRCNRYELPEINEIYNAIVVAWAPMVPSS